MQESSQQFMCSVRISHVPNNSQQFSLSEMLKCDLFLVANLVTDKIHSGHVHIHICAETLSVHMKI